MMLLRPHQGEDAYELPVRTGLENGGAWDQPRSALASGHFDPIRQAGPGSSRVAAGKAQSGQMAGRGVIPVVPGKPGGAPNLFRQRKGLRQSPARDAAISRKSRSYAARRASHFIFQYEARLAAYRPLKQQPGLSQPLEISACASN